MRVDDELQAWRDEWAAQPIADPDLGASVRRQSQLMRIMLLGEVLITVLYGGGTIWLAATSGQVDMAVLAGATWLFLAVAWSFGIWNRWGAWRPVGLTSAAYLVVSIRRCGGAIRAVHFGVLLFAAEMLFCLAWIYRRTGDASFLRSPAMAATGVATVGFLAGVMMYRSRKRRELARLLRLATATR